MILLEQIQLEALSEGFAFSAISWEFLAVIYWSNELTNLLLALSVSWFLWVSHLIA